MPNWLVWFLLIVFVVHLIAFGRLALIHRNLRYSLITLTFLLLVGAFGLRLGAPDLMVGDLPLHWFLRRAAWVSAAVTITMLIVRRFKKAA